MKVIDSMVGVITAHIPGKKFVHHKRKGAWSCGVCLKAWSEWCMLVPMEGHPSSEQVVGEYAGMGKAINNFLHLHVDVYI
jgi:hypothetical protein